MSANELQGMVFMADVDKDLDCYRLRRRKNLKLSICTASVSVPTYRTHHVQTHENAELVLLGCKDHY